MAAYIESGFRSTSSNGSDVRVLADGDRLYVAESAILSALGEIIPATSDSPTLFASAVETGNATTIVVNGELFSAYGFGVEGLTNNAVTVGAAGYVYGNLSGVTLGAGSRVVNDGSIDAGGSGVVLSGGNGLLGNNGSVSGFDGVNLSGNFSTIINGGTITSTGTDLALADGIYVFGVNTRIVNTGTITAVGDAVEFANSGAGFNRLDNTGVITSTGSIGLFSPPGTAFRGSDTFDFVVNSGLMIGDLRFGGANDTYDGRGGRVQGSVNGDAGDDVLRGGTSADTLGGGDDEDRLFGYGGDDFLGGNDDADTLFGGLGDDTVWGGAGNDSLVGGAGLDNLDGGTGSDLASYAGAGLGVTASLAAPNLNTGDAAGDTYSLIEGLVGSLFNDRLFGDARANSLDGSLGADLLSGGLGNDTYYVDNAGDRVVEAAGAGTDTVRASITVALAAEVENLVLTGSDALDGNGNALANSLSGNAAANRLNGLAGNDNLGGGLGADTLAGGGGQDTFSFTNAPDAVDRVLDFAPADDTIFLLRSAFPGLPALLPFGSQFPLPPNAFRVGAAAADADDRIIYNQATGALRYDADGNGAGGAVRFAALNAGLSLTAADFVVLNDLV